MSSFVDNGVINFTERITSRGTGAVDIQFFEGTLEVIPKEIKYTIKNCEGATIGTVDRGITPTAHDVTIPLCGDDVDQVDGLVRIVTINAVYDSVKYGDDKPLNGQVKVGIIPDQPPCP